MRNLRFSQLVFTKIRITWDEVTLCQLINCLPVFRGSVLSASTWSANAVRRSTLVALVTEILSALKLELAMVLECVAVLESVLTYLLTYSMEQGPS